MAGSSLLLLIDDIAAVLDDVAVMTKMAAKKTSGVLGDDLALNAQQVSGVHADRELPIVWAVAKGSMKNKFILAPLALILSALLPVVIIPLLMLGGLYLCYEGFEKVLHSLFHHTAPTKQQTKPDEALSISQIVDFEQQKIKGAIRTDFILSAEIITITLGTVANAPLMQQAIVVCSVALVMTVGVYGLVAGIVRLDDGGLYLCRSERNWQRVLGRKIVGAAPYMMKILSVVGTAAMFFVGGSILIHAIPPLHHFIEGSSSFVTLIAEAITGLSAGALVLGIVQIVRRIFSR